jgi:hypothetical protein
MADQSEQTRDDAEAEPEDQRQRHDSDRGESRGSDGQDERDQQRFDDFALI